MDSIHSVEQRGDNCCNVLALDPGSTDSGYVLYNFRDLKIIEFGKVPNSQIITILDTYPYETVVCEMIASYGMGVGATVFETCVWIGRFQERAKAPFELMFRREVKMTLCGTMKAKDGNIRQRIIDLYGSDPKLAIGTKKKPGPLYGLKADIWQAMALAITWCLKHQKIRIE